VEYYITSVVVFSIYVRFGLEVPPGKKNLMMVADFHKLLAVDENDGFKI